MKKHNNQEEYPRVLIINGEPFWQGSATGITMSRLFKGWPPQKLACLYLSDISPDRTYCDHYWSLSLFNLRGLNWILNNLKWQGNRTQMLNDIPESNSSSSHIPLSKVSTIRTKIRKVLAGQSLRELGSYTIPSPILQEIEKFQPQVIYSMLGSNIIMQLVIKISKLFNIPIIPHFMDDWPPVLYSTSLFRPILQYKMRKNINVVFSRSPSRMVIGDTMAKEYSSRYGGEFFPFMNSIEPEWSEQLEIPQCLRSKVRILYIGGLHLNRSTSLRQIGLALRKIKESGIDVEAKIYCQTKDAREAEKLEIPSVMQYAGSLPSKQIPGVLRDADILLHIESFDSVSRKFARFSISSKIPEYMHAAKPIFAYGPCDLASIQYIAESGVGLVVGTQNQEMLLSSLHRLCTSIPLRESLGLKGFQVASQRHDAVKQREQFRRILCKVSTLTFK